MDFLNQLYVRARYLRPDITRWLTRDAFWVAQSPYNYGGLRPTMSVDTSGLDVTGVGAIVGCFLGAAFGGFFGWITHFGKKERSLRSHM